jgi:hypothetical protein
MNFQKAHFGLAGCIFATMLITSCDQIQFLQSVPDSDTIKPVPAMHSLFGGGDTSVFQMPDSNTVTGDGAGAMISSTQEKAASSYTTQGAYLTLDTEWETSAIGKMVEVTVTARASYNNPSPSFGVAYSTAASGNSGWTFFELGPETKEYAMQWQVPTTPQAPGNDYVGIWADPLGQGRSIIVDQVQIRLVEPAE